jgi:hypothetical protein
MRRGDDPRRLVEIVDRALQDSFGIDPTSEHDDMCALATTGLVVSCWRNTVLENIHAGGFVSNARRGSYARDGIPDRDMARLNVATWRQVRPHVHPTGIDVLAVRALLREQEPACTSWSENVSMRQPLRGSLDQTGMASQRGCVAAGTSGRSIGWR